MQLSLGPTQHSKPQECCTLSPPRRAQDIFCLANTSRTVWVLKVRKGKRAFVIVGAAPPAQMRAGPPGGSQRRSCGQAARSGAECNSHMVQAQHAGGIRQCRTSAQLHLTQADSAFATAEAL